MVSSGARYWPPALLNNPSMRPPILGDLLDVRNGLADAERLLDDSSRSRNFVPAMPDGLCGAGLAHLDEQQIHQASPAWESARTPARTTFARPLLTAPAVSGPLGENHSGHQFRTPKIARTA